jgi:L-rhamnose mutarotase
MNKRHCFTLDLRDAPRLIAEYKRYHEHIWPEITASLQESGIEDAEIYLFGTRLFMILEVRNLPLNVPSRKRSKENRREKYGKINSLKATPLTRQAPGNYSGADYSCPENRLSRSRAP